jgi:hypothetical protein
MKDVLQRAGITWHDWHGFRRGLASNLNRLGVDDSVTTRAAIFSRAPRPAIGASLTAPLTVRQVIACKVDASDPVSH